MALYLGDMANIDVERGHDGGGGNQQVVGLEELRHPVIEGAARPLRPAQVVRRQFPALFDVPHDFRLHEVAVTVEKRREIRKNLVRPQHMEDGARVTQVRARLLDVGAELREAGGGGGAYLRHVVCHRDDTAKVRAVGDALGRLRAFHRVHERPPGGRQGNRIGRMSPDLGIEHQGRVGDGSCHRPLDPEVVVRQPERAAGDPARRRPEADDRAESGRRAQAAAQIRPRRQPDLAGGHGNGRPSGRPSAGHRRVPRIARFAEDLVEGVGAVAEFRRVRLGQDDGAIVLQGLNQDVGSLGDMIGENGRAVCGAYAGHVLQVLDGDGQAGEQRDLPLRCRAGPHQSLGVLAGALDAQRRQGVDLAVRRLDPRDGGIDHLQGRHLAPAQQIDGRARGQPCQFAHLAPPVGPARFPPWPHRPGRPSPMDGRRKIFSPAYWTLRWINANACNYKHW